MRKWWREDLLTKTQTQSQCPRLSPWRGSSLVTQEKEAVSPEYFFNPTAFCSFPHPAPASCHSLFLAHWSSPLSSFIFKWKREKRREFDLIIFSKYLLPQDKVFQHLSVQRSLSAHIPTAKSCPCDSADLEKALNTKNVVWVSVILLWRFISSFRGDHLLILKL